MSKKILFIITQAEQGGAQEYVYKTATGLDSGKYEIMVSAGPSGGWNLLERLEKKGVNTVKLKFLKRSINPIFDILGIIEIYRLIKKERPDFIYLHSSKAGILGAFAAFFFRRWKQYPKIVYRIGGWAFNEKVSFVKKWIYAFTERLSAHFKDVIIVNSEADKKAAISRKICSENKIQVIYNGIDVENINFLEKNIAREFVLSRLSSASDKVLESHSQYPGYGEKQQILIGTIANFYANKGLPYLIEAARVLCKRKNDLLFVIVGDGAERRNLEDLIKRYHLESNFFLAGSMINAFQYLKAFDLFVLSSIKEGMPWTVLEAMAAAVPIVATKVGGVPEMIEPDRSGILVDPQDSEALAEAIEKIAASKILQETLSANAFERVKEKFSLSEMLEKTKRLFE